MNYDLQIRLILYMAPYLMLFLLFIGDAAYWDDRYREIDSDGDGEESMSSPFDWLFSYEDVRGIVTTLLPDRKVPAFLIGCGNAPFSIDMVRFIF